jgi:predicted amidohydrolase
MAPATRRLAALQTRPTFGEVEQNLAAIEAEVEGLRADLLVLPEFAATGYSFRDRAEARALAEPWPDGPSLSRLSALSAATGGVVVAGYPERYGERLYNAAAIFAAGRPLRSYRKVHLFGFERECFDPGDRGFFVVEHEGLRVGTMVCFDWIFPEAARTLALQGADVIAHPSNLVLPGWCQQAMKVRALENRVFAVTANRYGVEERSPRPRLLFTGESQVVGPEGRARAQAPAEGTALLVVEVDPKEARSKAIPSGNDLFRERRPEAYL